jgi:hypothetical protein
MARARARVPLIALVLLSAAAVIVPQAQDQSLAILATGPEPRRGIELFAPDLTPYWFGRYSVPGGTVEVRYTTDRLPQTEQWSSAGCASRAVVTDGVSSYRYTAEDGSWSVLMTTDGTVDLCSFADRFVTRFQFFQQVDSRGTAGRPAFPAILELP